MDPFSSLFSYLPADLFVPLSSPHRELYWEVLLLSSRLSQLEAEVVSSGRTRDHLKARIAGLSRLSRELEEGADGLSLLSGDFGLPALATPKERCDAILPAIGRATCVLVLRDQDQVLCEPFQCSPREGEEPTPERAKPPGRRRATPTKQG